MSNTLARVALVVFLAACANPNAAAEDASWLSRLLGSSAVGSGNVTSEVRATAGFQEVAVGGSMKVLLHQSVREGVEVSAENNLLALTETRVSNGTLHIEAKRGASYTSRNPVVVTLNFIALTALSLGGSAAIAGSNIKGTKLSVRIGGSGSVKLAVV